MISNSGVSTNAALVPDTATKADQVAVGTESLETQKTAVLDEARIQETSTAVNSAQNIGSEAPGQPALSLPSSLSLSDTESELPSSSAETILGRVDELNQNNKRLISLTAKWNGKQVPFEVDLDYTIGELKYKLEDHVVLSSLSLKNNQTFLMMGTPEHKVIKPPETMPDVLNDLEEDYTPDDEAFASMAQNQKSLKSTISKCKIAIMNELRPGKKLLVLDLDYTLIDCKALNNSLVEVMRPGLHDFLAVCYEHYDIVIWSQTSWRALEAKVTTIGLLTHPDYKISFVMDISTMFSVLSQRDGKPFRHQVKALDIIWAKFPQYSARNTIHIDDLSRNFAMNPRSGLKIGAFKNGAVSRHTDRELYYLARYLNLVIQAIIQPEVPGKLHNHDRVVRRQEIPKARSAQQSPMQRDQAQRDSPLSEIAFFFYAQLHLHPHHSSRFDIHQLLWLITLKNPFTRINIRLIFEIYRAMSSTRSSSRLREAQMKTEPLKAPSAVVARKRPAPAASQSTPSATKSSLASLPSSAASSAGRSTRSTRLIVKNEDGEPDDETLKRLKLEADEHRSALAAEKRGLENSSNHSNKRRSYAVDSKAALKKIKDEATEEKVSSTANKVATAVKKSKFATKAPVGWEVTLDRLRQFRLENPAPVDTMGCERLAEVGEHVPAEVSRFQTLMSLVLSSQTKDTVTSVAIWRLQKELKGGLTIQGVLDTPAEELNKIISAVGFHNKKTIFMKQVAEICRDKYHGDIPGTAEELIALPGVGPKMAYLTLQCAWNKNLGIGVDTHVHRISNRLGWVKTEKDGPEATREALQSWLPKEHWREINYILVGFGQVLCLPRGPLCEVCPVQERCPSACISKSRKRIKTEVKVEMQEPFGEVEIHAVHTKVENTGLQGTDQKIEVSDSAVKQEEDGEKESHYFVKDEENGAEVKEEIVEHENVLRKNLHLDVDSSKLDQEAADIEDLVT
ncbi:DNA N-glycosylase and apurinic/apyrimidinic (AP) lyase [Mortierella claussenii]|nr:DNA N-glycosylase and apurinic/apyrimidinic (AP) lyase [Mortierella claussenii]